MKIAIFGGAFNPIHKGHLGIAKEAISELNLDKLFFVPVFVGPFKRDVSLESSQHRLNMIKLILEEKMEVSTFEIDRKGVSYTIDTIKFFKNKYPKDELFLIIGSDNIKKLSKWKDIEEISKLAKIVAFKRASNVNKTHLKQYNGILLKNKIYRESSTRFISGKFFDVDEKVRKYIGQHQIYFQNILKNTLTQQRYLHCLHARDFAIECAKNLKFDCKKAAFSAMVHDIAKQLDEHSSRNLIKKFEPQSLNIEKYKLHQEAGYVILKHIFNIEEEIAHSVRVHTSLDFELNLLDKIVFMADKLCKGRKWEGIQKIRKLALTNFEQAFKLVVQRTKQFNLNKGIKLTIEQESIYKKWEK